jgi:hypothetical protein
MYVCMYVYDVCAFLYICRCICMYVGMCVCIYIYIYIYIYKLSCICVYIHTLILYIMYTYIHTYRSTVKAYASCFELTQNCGTRFFGLAKGELYGCMMQVCMYVCKHVSRVIYTCVYVCIYIYIFMFRPDSELRYTIFRTGQRGVLWMYDAGMYVCKHVS